MSAQRSIKFRIWDKTKQEYLKYDCWFPHRDFERFTCFDRDFITTEEDIVIEQFSGLLDVQGKDLFEGDIIEYSRLFDKEQKIKTLRSYIRFDEGKFGFDMIGFNGMFMGLYDEYYPRLVGNLMQNPELLTKCVEK